MEELEHQLVRVPYEVLKTSVRLGLRTADKELSAVTAIVRDAAQQDVPTNIAAKNLHSCVNRLVGLKRKLGEMHAAEEQNVRRSRARLDHLSNFSLDSKSWKKTKVDRLVADYLLRCSYMKTATKLVDMSSIQDLADLDLFGQAQRIIDALKNRSCKDALNWCDENKAKLRKSPSVLEFRLRIQEFIELVRAEKTLDAVEYARKFVSHLAAVDMQLFQEAMATLVLKKTSSCAFYKTLLDDSQWEKLIQLFKEEFCKINGMTSPSLLHIYIQAGLSALKTPSCYEEKCPNDDPMSNDAIRKLADPLPFMKNIHSRLICHMTKELMNEDNPAFVLPNGYAYSAKAIEAMTLDLENGSHLICPRTKEIFPVEATIRAFIS